MHKGSKSGGGQGSPDRAAEEQATTRGDRGFERASRAEIIYVHCLRFLSGLFYIVTSNVEGRLEPARERARPMVSMPNPRQVASEGKRSPSSKSALHKGFRTFFCELGNGESPVWERG
jgi:hypothetical protein